MLPILIKSVFKIKVKKGSQYSITKHRVPELIQIKVKKGSPYSITKHRVPELIRVLGRQPADDVS